MADERTVISMKSSNGESIPCQILDIFEFMESDYALMFKVVDESLVIMRMVVKEGTTVFQNIESEEEFDRVAQHVQLLATMDEE